MAEFAAGTYHPVMPMHILSDVITLFGRTKAFTIILLLRSPFIIIFEHISHVFICILCEIREITGGVNDICSFSIVNTLVIMSGTVFVKPSESPSKTALRNVRAAIEAELDVNLILPYLRSYELLTQDQELYLRSFAIARVIKVRELVTWLPSKGPDFLEKFIACLTYSAEEQMDHKHYALAKQLEIERAKAEEELKTEEELRLQTYGMLSIRMDHEMCAWCSMCARILATV